MHETSLNGTVADYLTGEARERTTYEDLRQALAKFLVEDRGYCASLLQPRHTVAYSVDNTPYERQADIAVFCSSGLLGMLVVFCSGQVHTYMREVMSLSRLALPYPSPLAVVTDMRAAELFAVKDGSILAEGLSALPPPETMEVLANLHAHPPLRAGQRDKESRILHAYSGFLKSCCIENCPPG
ncbi:MAG: type I restriction enzyme HsdR N-terminal domain-containing protein [Desulfovibrio sp.]|jgi:hypothetical protein|nr:type I restriction enzyme HsdR N-terminal domain-containing protein [Desulfovibrio sp.]